MTILVPNLNCDYCGKKEETQEVISAIHIPKL